MREGNIRISPESGGINLQVMPSKAQESALDDFISRERGEVTLDIDNENGETIVFHYTANVGMTASALGNARYAWQCVLRSVKQSQRD